jgi:hypothetical protein
MASEDTPATGIPDDVASMWKTLDPAIRAALIASESKAEGDKKEASGGGAEGRRAKASDGPRMDDSTSKFIGGDSFTKRTANPQWIKVRSDVYDAVKDRRQKELDAKVPVDIEVTLPDGKTLSADKVSRDKDSTTLPFSFFCAIYFSSCCAVV